MSEIQTLCEQTVQIVREIGRSVRKFRQENEPSVEIKGKNDFVTQVDKETEKRLVKALTQLLPEAGFLTEEKTINKKGAHYNWIVDPIDGTTNFIHGLFPYAISIALMREEEIVAGVVYEMGQDECFYAWENGPALLNGIPIHVSKAPKVTNSLIATGFPYTQYHLMEPFMETLDYFMKNSHGLRRLGSAATDLAYVACGRFDAFYEYSLKPWDVAAGAFLVQQAGGKLADFKGSNQYLFGGEIIASNDLLFKEISETITKIMTTKK